RSTRTGGGVPRGGYLLSSWRTEDHSVISQFLQQSGTYQCVRIDDDTMLLAMGYCWETYSLSRGYRGPHCVSPALFQAGRVHRVGRYLLTLPDTQYRCRLIDRGHKPLDGPLLVDPVSGEFHRYKPIDRYMSHACMIGHTNLLVCQRGRILLLALAEEIL
ncbi:hypothetical protein KIPB_012608, partial [Kipferlia bialata]